MNIDEHTTIGIKVNSVKNNSIPYVITQQMLTYVIASALLFFNLCAIKVGDNITIKEINAHIIITTSI